MLTILGSMVDVNGGPGGGEPIWPLYEHKNLHFNNTLDIHMSFKEYEANG